MSAFDTTRWDSRARHLTASVGRVRAGQAALALLLGFSTLLLAVDPTRRVAVDAPVLEISVASVAIFVTLAVALLGLVRWREVGDVTALFDASALGLVTVANAINLLFFAATLGPAGEADAGSLRASPLYALAIVRVTALGLLLVGMLPIARRRRPGRWQAAAIVIAPIVVLGIVTWLLVSAEQTGSLAVPAVAAASGTGEQSGWDGITPLTLLDVAGIIAIAIAAAGRPGQTGGALPAAWIATALTIAAFAQLHFVLFPTEQSSLSTADVLQVAFYVTLFAALQVTHIRDFRVAREALDRGKRLWRSDVAEAVQAERLHVAREIHDGVVQELVALRRQLDHVHDSAEPSPQAPCSTCQGARAIATDALLGTRRTINGLRGGDQDGAVLAALLPWRLREFADAHGHAVDVQLDPVLELVAGRRAAETLRMVDEALANVRRHADATAVRVTVSRAGQAVLLTIVDNGRGFAPERIQLGHGLLGMRERAALIGGNVSVTSAPGEGTQVRLFVPLRTNDGD